MDVPQRAEWDDVDGGCTVWEARGEEGGWKRKRRIRGGVDASAQRRCIATDDPVASTNAISTDRRTTTTIHVDAYSVELESGRATS
jgi:hypothetical protein